MLRYPVSILLIAAFSAFGEFSFGVDLGINLNNNTTENPSTTVAERTNSSRTYSIAPFVGIHPSELLEISPYFGWNMSSSSSETIYTSTTATNTKTTLTQHSLEPGCGVFFHVIRGEVFDISLGPKLGYRINFEPKNTSSSSTTTQSIYSSYYNASTSIGCQFNIDLLFSKRFASRLSTSLFKYYYSSFSYEFENDLTPTSEGHTSTTDFRSIFQPSFGFIFTF